MSELSKILWTSGLTVVSGTLVYALGNVFVRLFLEPVIELKKTIGEIGDLLIFYANVYMHPIRQGEAPSEKHQECTKALRQAATRLMGKTYSVSLFWPFALVRIVPFPSKVRQAHTALIALSNSVGDQDTLAVDRRRGEVERSLGLYSTAG